MKKKATDKTHLVTGLISGTIARCVTHPLERLRILQQIGDQKYKGRGTINSINFMFKTEGLSGLFKGNLVNLAASSPFSALEFYFYEVYKNNLFPNIERQDLTFYHKVLCGALTGVSAQVFV